MSGFNTVNNSSCEIPQSVSYSDINEMSCKLFNVEKIDICENFVMPVMKTKRRYGSSSLSGEKKLFCCSRTLVCKSSSCIALSIRASYSSIIITTFLPVCLKIDSTRLPKRTFEIFSTSTFPFISLSKSFFEISEY